MAKKAAKKRVTASVTAKPPVALFKKKMFVCKPLRPEEEADYERSLQFTQTPFVYLQDEDGVIYRGYPDPGAFGHQPQPRKKRAPRLGWVKQVKKIQR